MKTEAATTAKAIRAELKKSFPNVKFSVTSETFSMGDAVRISWTDGPRESAVEAITGKYQAGSFNGMEDIYEYDNVISNIPQAKYITTGRHTSEATRQTIIAKLSQQIEGFDPDMYVEGIGRGVTLIHREFSKMTF
jgi:hypothetical protein